MPAEILAEEGRGARPGPAEQSTDPDAAAATAPLRRVRTAPAGIAITTPDFEDTERKGETHQALAMGAARTAVGAAAGAAVRGETGAGAPAAAETTRDPEVVTEIAAEASVEIDDTTAVAAAQEKISGILSCCKQ